MIRANLPEIYRKNPNLHAYLFVSGDISARREAAKLISKSMLCRNVGEDAEPCVVCDCCIKVEAVTHPDCICYSDGSKTKVEDVRKIEDEAHLSTNEADSKVFILEDADGYNDESQNALLKIVEEPPKNVKFVLTASSVAAILPTVRSRVCTLTGNVRSKADILREIKLSKPALDEAGANSLASFIENYDMADLKSLDEEQFFDYVNKAYLFLSGKDTSVMMALPKKREDLMLLIQVFMLAVRQIAYTKAAGKLSDGIFDAGAASECNAKTSMKRAHALYDVFEEGYLLAEGYANINAVNSYLLENVR